LSSVSSTNKTKSNSTKQKLQSGTISKVISYDFTRDEINFLWDKHNNILKEAEQPAERYTRTLADLIRELRDVSEKLILSGAISGYMSQKDTASYVWKQIKDRNIHCFKQNFYTYFEDFQKRDYQTPAFLEKLPDKSHNHNFQEIVGNFEGVGEFKRCAANGDVLCQAVMIDGQIFENRSDKDSDIDLTKKPPKDPIFYEEENEYALLVLQKVINSLKSVQQYFVKHPAFSELNKEEQREFREVLFMIEKSTEFVNASYNDKTKIPTMTEHKLVFSFAEETQNAAGGLYLWLLRKFGAKKVEHAKDVLSNYIVPKQTTKKMAGKTPQLHPRYDPKNEEEAMDRGFYGTKCSNKKCPSFGFRIDYDRVVVGKKIDEVTGEAKNLYDNKLVCFACGTIQVPTTIKLEKMHPKVTMDFDSSV